MQKIHLITAGRHAPNKGDAVTLAPDTLRSIAGSYSAELHEAPMVVGHPAADRPAYGWVAGLEARDDGLWAEPHQVDPAFAEMVQNGRFKKVSISLYRPEHPSNPKPGAWYLRHVGFLGAQPPAVKGLKPVEFADAGDEGILTVEFAEGWALGWLFSDIAGLFRGLRDHLVGAVGADQAEKLLPGNSVQRIAEEAVRIQERSAAEAAPAITPTPAFTEGDPNPKQEPSVDETEIARQREELQAREQAIAAREAEFAERDAANRRAADAAFVGGLVSQARLPQGLAPRAVAVLGALAAETEVTFAEGDGEVKRDARAALRELLTALPPKVEFGEKAPAGPVSLDDANAIAAAAAEFQEKEGKAGRSVSTAAAVQHVTTSQRAAA